MLRRPIETAPAKQSLIMTATNGRSEPILRKNTLLLAQKVRLERRVNAFLIRPSAFAAVQEISWPVCGGFGRLRGVEIRHLRRMVDVIEDALASRPSIGIRIVASELPERLALGADVLVPSSRNCHNQYGISLSPRASDQ